MSAANADELLQRLVEQFADPYDFLRELVQNAMDAGSDRVDVSLYTRRSADRADDAVVFEIAVVDAGCGMDAELLLAECREPSTTVSPTSVAARPDPMIWPQAADRRLAALLTRVLTHPHRLWSGFMQWRGAALRNAAQPIWNVDLGSRHRWIRAAVSPDVRLPTLALAAMLVITEVLGDPSVTDEPLDAAMARLLATISAT